MLILKKAIMAIMTIKMKFFGTSGVRGIYGEKITEELATELGKAFGTYVKKKKVAVAMDSRLSCPALKKSLIKGLSLTGIDIADFGIVPTPLLAFGTRIIDAGGGIMITASHNPPKYNGFKTWAANGRCDTTKEESEIEDILINKKFKLNENKNNIEFIEIKPTYVDEIKKRFNLNKKMKVLVDCVNGAACEISPFLLREFGYEVISINDEFDGRFPNRLPEPIEENLKKTCNKVIEEGAQIGFCHDGDADRMVPIDEKGKMCDFDKFITFMSKKAVEETGVKKVITTVETSIILDKELGADVEVVRTRVGDYAVSEILEKNGGCIGIEPAGAIIFPEFGLWPDGIYSIFKLLKYLEDEDRKLSEIMDSIEKYPFQRLKISCKEEDKKRIMEEIEKQIPNDVKVSKIDGIRMEWPNSWILIRASGTEPYIRITAEAKTEQDLKAMIDYWEEKINGLI